MYLYWLMASDVFVLQNDWLVQSVLLVYCTGIPSWRLLWYFADYTQASAVGWCIPVRHPNLCRMWDFVLMILFRLALLAEVLSLLGFWEFSHKHKGSFTWSKCLWLSLKWLCLNSSTHCVWQQSSYWALALL